METKKKRKLRLRRHRRLRYKISGSTGRPRLSVFKSLRHFYAQLIDDEAGRTLLSASTLDKELRERPAKGNPTAEVCKNVADLLCKRAKEKGITQVVFDHGGFGYRGRIKAFADRAREKGLEF
jgi:large subunit ribosomal protein L18